MKIGQEVEFRKNFKIETELTKTVLHVKEGDRAIATRTGLKILSGEGRGKITDYIDEQPKGIDYRNISKMIMQRLDCTFGLEEFIDYEGIDFSEMIDEVEDVLMDIL